MKNLMKFSNSVVQKNSVHFTDLTGISRISKGTRSRIIGRDVSVFYTTGLSKLSNLKISSSFISPNSRMAGHKQINVNVSYNLPK